jgi:hypothetical protein
MAHHGAFLPAACILDDLHLKLKSWQVLLGAGITAASALLNANPW